MRIKALANGNVIEAHEDAAKILIENKIYEETDEPLTGSPPVASDNSTQPPAKTKPTKKRKAR